MVTISSFIRTVTNATLQISRARLLLFLIPVSQRTARLVTRRIWDGVPRHIATRTRCRDFHRTTDIDQQHARSVTRIRRTIRSLVAKAAGVIIRARGLIDMDVNIKNPNHAKGGFSTDCIMCHTMNAWKPATFDHATINFLILQKS
jgi:hypothetical protein